MAHIIEGITQKQITGYIENKPVSFITRWRKSYGTHHSLIMVLRNWKRAINKGSCVSALQMDSQKSLVL